MIFGFGGYRNPYLRRPGYGGYRNCRGYGCYGYPYNRGYGRGCCGRFW